VNFLLLIVFIQSITFINYITSFEKTVTVNLGIISKRVQVTADKN